MHIEIFKRGGFNKAKQCETPHAWFWHFKNKGRITADAEPFPTKAHALRAAKAVVTAVLKPTGAAPHFTAVLSKDTTITKITWV